MGSITGRKEIGMARIFFRFVIGILLVDALILLLAAGITSFAFYEKYIYPADYEERLIEAAAPNILEAETVTEDMIPSLCEYVVFDLEGKVLSGTMDDKETQAAWYAIGTPYYSYGGKYFRPLNREQEYCVISYRLEPQFRAEGLRHVIKHPQNLLMFIVFVLLVVSTILFAVRFGIMTKKSLQPILQITQKIETRDLDFAIETGKVKEVNQILFALDHLKDALKESLQKEWEKEQLRRNQISGLAHDIKTPITVVKGNTEILYDLDPTENQRECLEDISDSVNRVEEYVKALIEVNKAEVAKEPEFTSIIMPEFVAEIESQMKGLCKTKAQKCQLQDHSGVKELRGDRALLMRAITNLLSNAVAYTGEGGQVVLDIQWEKDRISFCVKDEGPGFSPEGLKYATQLFYTEDKSRSGGIHYGIGLYEVATIARQHGGEVLIQNGEKVGAEVTILLPCTSH